MITLLTAAEASESVRAFLAAAVVAPEVFELRPDYRVLVMAAEGLEPGPPDQVSDELLARAETRARTALDGRAPEDVPQVADWRDAYRVFGAKPQRTRPSVEALLRRLDAGLPRIDRLTDAYNAVSIANLVPVGGEDLDRYQGPARLVRAGRRRGLRHHSARRAGHRAPPARRGDLAGRRRRHLSPVELAAMHPDPDNDGHHERRLHHRRARRARTRRPDRSGDRPRQLPHPAEPAGRHRQPAHHRRPAAWRAKAGGPDEAPTVQIFIVLRAEPGQGSLVGCL